ncbi:MAG: hypothetical protein EBU49_09565 [Proteobacteria bacterium]|nr:hypothetical protein [Pseudomonadota bacterium]
MFGSPVQVFRIHRHQPLRHGSIQSPVHRGLPVRRCFCRQGRIHCQRFDCSTERVCDLGLQPWHGRK